MGTGGAPAGGMIGADPDQLDDLARELSGAADRLVATHSALRGRLHTAPWSGSDAQAFRHDWDTTHHQAIGAAGRRLRDASVALTRQADEQRRASAAPGAGSPAGLAGPGGGPGPIGGLGLAVPVGMHPAGGPSIDGFTMGPPTEPPLTFTDSFPYDPDARATPADHAAWLKWGAQAAGAHLIRPDLDDALRVYDHYRDNTGTPMTVDYEEAYREDAAIAAAVDAELARARTAAQDLAAQTGQSSFSMSGAASLASALSGYPSTENWQKALGDHQLWSSADVTIAGGTATMVITVHAHDRYDFNAGMSDIATGTPDDENGRFAVLGWAKPFDTRGELTRTITWPVGDSIPITAGEGDVSRNPGSEDRPDELGSGRPSWPPIPDTTPLDGT